MGALMEMGAESSNKDSFGQHISDEGHCFQQSQKVSAEAQAALTALAFSEPFSKMKITLLKKSVKALMIFQAL